MQLAGVGAQAGPVLVEALWEAFPTWSDGIADHRFRYSPSLRSATVATSKPWGYRLLQTT